MQTTRIIMDESQRDEVWGQVLYHITHTQTRLWVDGGPLGVTPGQFAYVTVLPTGEVTRRTTVGESVPPAGAIDVHVFPNCETQKATPGDQAEFILMPDGSLTDTASDALDRMEKNADRRAFDQWFTKQVAADE